jgi:mannitol/fructose-specific phosphotransferase system IIA component (Ntr-type)|tara:strand:- start:256 stop:738 length:483 start_codon:yes stop_codon:yes gene_type:complete
MNLASLKPEQIVPELQSTDHLEVISELVGLLFDYLEQVQHNPLPEAIKEKTYASLTQREEKISTGIGSGVAIPHAFSEDIEEMAVIFGRSKKGVDFEAVDNNPVYFIVLFLVPQKDYHQHLQTLAAIAKLFTRSDIRKELALAETRDDILAVFKKHVVTG